MSKEASVSSPGSKRASDQLEDFEAAEEEAGRLAEMTEEEREYLRWFYRTEDCEWCFLNNTAITLAIYSVYEKIVIVKNNCHHLSRLF